MESPSSPDTPVFAAERQARIAELIAVRGRARIGELAELFGVTEPTVRKDLSALQTRGLLKRTHGGAIALRPLVDRDLAAREATNRSAKERIGRACLGLLHDGDAVFLDSGTSVAAVAGALAAEPGAAPRNLTVLTNTPAIASAVAEVPSLEHVVLGGQLRPASGSLIGALALHNLQRFTVGIAFIGVSGFSELGLSVAGAAEAEIKATAIERARRVVVPLDHTKVGATDFAQICGLEEVDTVVMDRATSEIQDLCATYEIELLVADD